LKPKVTAPGKFGPRSFSLKEVNREENKAEGNYAITIP